jgi:hypothetical protein
MRDLIERAEAAIAAWKAGAITHSLHVELASLVEELHQFVTAAPAPVTEPATVAIPPKETATE